MKENDLVGNDQQKPSLICRRFAKHLFPNRLKKKHTEIGSEQGNWYSTERHHTAMTLYYYSFKAYDMVRKFTISSHPSDLRTWAASVECEPDYLINVIKHIGCMTEKDTWMCSAVLIVDTLALHRGIY